MGNFNKIQCIMKDLFAKDYQFAMATVNVDNPSVRFVDTFYDEGCFYVVTYAKSQKVQDIEKNKKISLCNKLYRFNGEAYNIGHPLIEKNKEIRSKLIEAFKPWYFSHNNENDDNMCYLKIELKEGFIHKDRIGYKVDFKSKEFNEFPFDFDVVIID